MMVNTMKRIDKIFEQDNKNSPWSWISQS